MFLLWRGRRVDLTGKRVTIGRRGRNDVVIRGDPFVSKSHCIITNGALKDTSKNGTRVNGSRVEQHSLHPGDCIRIGNAVLEVYGGADESTSSMASSPRPRTHCLPHSHHSSEECKAMISRRMQRRAHAEQRVKCMIQLLKAFSVTKGGGGGSRTCRNQDRFCGRRDEKHQLLAQLASNRKTSLKTALLKGIDLERRNRVTFYRRTLRHLRRTQRLRRRMEKAWDAKFEKGDVKKK